MGNPLGVSAPASLLARLLALAARQHGLLTRRQWLESGLSQRQLEGALHSGALRSLHPGVYVVAGARPTFERDVIAACLATGGFASHGCAAHLWRFRKFDRPNVEVLVAKGHAPKLDGAIVRRTARLDPSEQTRIGSIPVVTRARTLLDLVAVTPRLVEGALDGVLHQRPRELRTIASVLERAGPHHPGRGLLPPLVGARVAGRRPTESELEDDLLALIRRFGFPEPVPQHPVAGRRIDFAYPELLFGIEANSVQAHAAREDVQRNAEKANDLVDWWILYFTYDDVHGAPSAVARRIDQTMARRSRLLGDQAA